MAHRMIHTEFLTAAQSREADRCAAARGTPFSTLMENAGRAVADFIHARYAPRPVLVVCGAGNNGGDGQIIARMLAAQGWPVTQAGPEGCTPAALVNARLVVDALFGTGLNRPPDGASLAAIAAVNAAGLPVVSVDIPSGIDADTGTVFAEAVRATHTVTFHRAKPGLYLLPARAHAGEIIVAPIGIPDDAVSAALFLNRPSLWRGALPVPTAETHKYTRGHALILGGGIATTGASRLAARAALRIGAGLVSIACPRKALPVYAAALEAVMTKPVATRDDLAALLADPRITAALIGPGHGVTPHTEACALDLLATRRPCVLDADALTCFARHPQSLFDALHESCILTPHEGEFARLFAVQGPRLPRAQAASAQSGAVLVLKGSDTVIAAPDGRAAINANAPPWLATAGSGDVLAGLITGLLAQGMPAFEAACASVWLHGEAANRFGPGMIAEDIERTLPDVINSLSLLGRGPG
jgi:NAD(P)H-hydrate epimerase